MTRYTNDHRTSARKPITIAAASVLTVGALAGAGVAGANAATPAAHPVSSNVQARATQAGLLDEVRDAFSSVDGAKAKDAANKLISNPNLLAKLPAALQTDLKSLASAATPQDASTLAQQIKTTALNGGYGAQAQQFASHVLGSSQDSSESSDSKQSLLQDLKAAEGQGQQAAESSQRLAKRALADPELSSKLPANLKADLTRLASATGADVSAQAEKIKSTALSGGYGAQVQQLAQHLQTMATSATPDGSASGTAKGSASVNGSSSDAPDAPSGAANLGVNAAISS
ncbi:MAG: hypothetical protein HIU81_02440 [Acidobacteria bacterium]|nr:hypothetical protein [Acidobacteriota bacterium]